MKKWMKVLAGIAAVVAVAVILFIVFAPSDNDLPVTIENRDNESHAGIVRIYDDDAALVFNKSYGLEPGESYTFPEHVTLERGMYTFNVTADGIPLPEKQERIEKTTLGIRIRVEREDGELTVDVAAALT